MSTMAHRLAMSRLAPIQITSHGHPVTSGIPTIDYYVSWAAAELEYELASTHYTEELILLPGHTMHQYNERVLIAGAGTGIVAAPGGVVEGSGASKNKISIPVGARGDIFPSIATKLGDKGKNWYVCMQKPFKLHAKFGKVMAGILEADEDAVIVLHASDEKSGGEDRKWKLDEQRVFYMPTLPHHLLMALYASADVVLDGYYAGGCTTTREALEVGAVVVTLPGKYLGGRWSTAFYNIMGVEGAVANSEENYIEIAVRLGRDKDLLEGLRREVRENVWKLFQREESVEGWVNVLEGLANGDSANSRNKGNRANERANKREKRANKRINRGQRTHAHRGNRGNRPIKRTGNEL